MSGVLCGILFGDYCRALRVWGDAYVGLLQMTVLPYLVVSLVANVARLNFDKARRFGVVAVATSLLLTSIGVILILVVSRFLPPADGATLFSPQIYSDTAIAASDFVERFIPSNFFNSLAKENIPAVVVFSLLLGAALMQVPGKESLLHSLDLALAGLTRINSLLINLAPFGLFFLAADASGTIRIEELSKLQAYLIMLGLACGFAAFAILPALVCFVTGIRYRDLMRAAQAPMLTAFAAGKLIVVLPLIVEQCERLLSDSDETESGKRLDTERSVASVIVPMAYPFPHLGKILALVFVSFAAWYVGTPLDPAQTVDMGVTGSASSFASPLVSIPYLLDRYQLPQDLMSLFLLPGFITTRLGDVVGVMHLMALTLIVCRVTQGTNRVQWRRLALVMSLIFAALVTCGMGANWYLRSTIIRNDLDQRLLSLEIHPQSLHRDVVVYANREDVPPRTVTEGATLDRVRGERVLRVGYHRDHLPYSFVNRSGHLVGMDVELFHRLAKRLDLKLEFVPYEYGTVIEQLDQGEFDVAAGGIFVTPDRALATGVTRAYQVGTLAFVLPDHRRAEFERWDDLDRSTGLRVGTVFDDVTVAARKLMPNIDFVTIDSYQDYFDGDHAGVDGVVMPAEEGAAWCVIYPNHAVTVPRPAHKRPVAMAFEESESEWGRFLDQWLKFEELDGTIDELRRYWIEGGGTEERPPRWCVIRDVLGLVGNE